jgi:hypothetical protein
MSEEPSVTEQPTGQPATAEPGAATGRTRPSDPGGWSMYGWLWRHLPGGWPVRVAILVVAAAAVVVLLFLVVFPWVEPRLPFNQVTVGNGVVVGPGLLGVLRGWTP